MGLYLDAFWLFLEFSVVFWGVGVAVCWLIMLFPYPKGIREREDGELW